MRIENGEWRIYLPSVILSERSESKDLRSLWKVCIYVGATIGRPRAINDRSYKV